MTSKLPRCAGCRRELEIGDQYIKGSASEMLGEDVDPTISKMLADIFGGNERLDGAIGDRIIYCEDCTVPGGEFLFDTYYGDEEPDS